MKPILFNTPMVQAILAGKKTCTRRLVKPQPTIDGYGMWQWKDCQWMNDGLGFPASGVEGHAPYRKGDILYVRETFTKFYYSDEYGYTHFDQPMYYYAADGEPDIRLVDGDGFEEEDQRIRWTPSIHMPKDAARLFLRVTDVRAERLQDIDEHGARAEGAEMVQISRTLYSHRKGFIKLWDSTIKPADRDRCGWAANPWVWVICFERCEKPEERQE